MQPVEGENLQQAATDSARREAMAMNALAEISADKTAPITDRVTAAAMLLQAQQHQAKLQLRAADAQAAAARAAAAAERRAARLRTRAAKRAQKRRRRR